MCHFGGCGLCSSHVSWRARLAVLLCPALGAAWVVPHRAAAAAAPPPARSARCALLPALALQSWGPVPCDAAYRRQSMSSLQVMRWKGSHHRRTPRLLKARSCRVGSHVHARWSIASQSPAARATAAAECAELPSRVQCVSSQGASAHRAPSRRTYAPAACSAVSAACQQCPCSRHIGGARQHLVPCLLRSLHVFHDDPRLLLMRVQLARKPCAHASSLAGSASARGGR